MVLKTVPKVSGRVRFGVEKSHSFFTFLKNPITRINVRSEVGGDKYKLKDIPQISDYIVKKLKKFILKKIVYPYSHKFRLIWPRNWWPSGTEHLFQPQDGNSGGNNTPSQSVIPSYTSNSATLNKANALVGSMANASIHSTSVPLATAVPADDGIIHSSSNSNKEKENNSSSSSSLGNGPITSKLLDGANKLMNKARAFNFGGSSSSSSSSAAAGVSPSTPASTPPPYPITSPLPSSTIASSGSIPPPVPPRSNTSSLIPSYTNNSNLSPSDTGNPSTSTTANANANANVVPVLKKKSSDDIINFNLDEEEEPTDRHPKSHDVTASASRSSQVSTAAVTTTASAAGREGEKQQQRPPRELPEEEHLSINSYQLKEMKWLNHLKEISSKSLQLFPAEKYTEKERIAIEKQFYSKMKKSSSLSSSALASILNHYKTSNMGLTSAESFSDLPSSSAAPMFGTPALDKVAEQVDEDQIREEKAVSRDSFEITKHHDTSVLLASTSKEREDSEGGGTSSSRHSSIGRDPMIGRGRTKRSLSISDFRTETLDIILEGIVEKIQSKLSSASFSRPEDEEGGTERGRKSIRGGEDEVAADYEGMSRKTSASAPASSGLPNRLRRASSSITPVTSSHDSHQGYHRNTGAHRTHQSRNSHTSRNTTNDDDSGRTSSTKAWFSSKGSQAKAKFSVWKNKHFGAQQQESQGHSQSHPLHVQGQRDGEDSKNLEQKALESAAKIGGKIKDFFQKLQEPEGEEGSNQTHNYASPPPIHTSPSQQHRTSMTKVPSGRSYDLQQQQGESYPSLSAEGRNSGSGSGGGTGSGGEADNPRSADVGVYDRSSSSASSSFTMNHPAQRKESMTGQTMKSLVASMFRSSDATPSSSSSSSSSSHVGGNAGNNGGRQSSIDKESRVNAMLTKALNSAKQQQPSSGSPYPSLSSSASSPDPERDTHEATDWKESKKDI
jgi:hypothetical protein